jgi:hypothetical protein
VSGRGATRAVGRAAGIQFLAANGDGSHLSLDASFTQSQSDDFASSARDARRCSFAG